MPKRDGFSTVETDMDELDEKIRIHRKKIWIRTISVLFLAAVLIVLYMLISAIRSYESYEIQNTIDRDGNDAAHFAGFNGNYLEYSNDGIAYIASDGSSIWNQSFEMAVPQLEICGDYLAVYDKGGTDIYILNADGSHYHLETSVPIQTLCVAAQGTVAVLMTENAVSSVKLYNKNGEELASGEFFGDQGGYPFDIALSSDAQKLAIDMININDGNIKSTITFYNFGSVGQNEIDNNVGTYSYAGMLIAEVEYISKDCMLAFGDNEIVVFGGEQKPQVKEEIFISKEIKSIFYDDKYIGVVHNNQDEEGTYHILVYDLKGSKVMENDTSLAYDHIRFLGNHEICVTNDIECEIYTIHSIKKFAYQFDKKICEILSQGQGRNYTFVFDSEINEVRLQ